MALGLGPPDSFRGVPATERSISRDPDARACLKVQRDVPARWRCQRGMGGLRPQLAGDVEFHLQGETLEPDEESETNLSIPLANQAPLRLEVSVIEGSGHR